MQVKSISIACRWNSGVRMLTEEGKNRREALNADIEARIARFKEEQKDMLRELAVVGVHVDMVNRLPNWRTAEYSHALPILMAHLRKTYSDGTTASLARSLATKEARQYWDELVAMYRQSVNRISTGPGNVQMALAAAVGAACPPDRLSDLIDLLKDQTLPDRLLLLTPLKKKRGGDPKIAEVIEDLRRDPALAKEINSWKILRGQQVPHSH